MNQEKLVRTVDTLPAFAQQLVLDFATLLQSFYESTPESTQDVKGKIDFKLEPAFGIWKDREETQDSTAWVRNLRDSEWG